MCPPNDARPLVLVVEDEPTLRASVVRGLARSVAGRILGVGTVREARSAIEDDPPAMLISDIDLPDGTGLELVADLDDRGLHIPIVFVSSYVRNYADRVPRRAGVETYEKPVSLERLRSLVEKALAEPEAGPPFNAADYVQLAGMGRKSILIQVRARDGNTGRIAIRAGEIWSARDARGVGMPAFRRLAFAEGQVSCRALSAAELRERNVEGRCEELLMEAARQADELAAGSRTDVQDIEDVDVREPLESGCHPIGFEETYRRGVELLLERRYAEAYEVFTAAARLNEGDSRVLANLNRLKQLGFGT